MSHTPELIVDNLHVSVEGKEILKGLSLEVRKGEIHALMGPNGSGKSTFANTLMGHPRYEVTAGDILLQGREHSRDGARRALARGPVHGVPVPGRDPRALGRQLPAHRAQRAPGTGGDQRQRCNAQAQGHPAQGVPHPAPREDGAAQDGRLVRQPLPERRFLGRREEARRDPPDGDAQARDRDHGRDRLRARHRRAAHRVGRRQRAGRARTWACW